jgi:hypothetical protein
MHTAALLRRIDCCNKYWENWLIFASTPQLANDRTGMRSARLFDTAKKRRNQFARHPGHRGWDVARFHRLVG